MLWKCRLRGMGKRQAEEGRRSKINRKPNHVVGVAGRKGKHVNSPTAFRNMAKEFSLYILYKVVWKDVVVIRYYACIYDTKRLRAVSRS